MEEKNSKKLGGPVALIIIVVIVFFGIILLLSDKKQTPVSTNPSHSQEEKQDALSMIQAVFVGNLSREEIKEKLDLVLKSTNTDITEENYSRAGSVLVDARKNTGLSEIKLLDCMAGLFKEKTNNIKVTFPEASALCTTILQKE
jgi:hypothetical protein